MPCDTVRTVTVELVAADRGVLTTGLKAAGYTVTELRDGSLAVRKGYTAATIKDGRITFTSGEEHVVNDVKRAYAVQAVKTAAARFSWKLTQDAKEPQHLTLNKRTF